jgi:hypothetical protein
MYEPAYKCRNRACKGCVRIENTYCEPCYLAYKSTESWLTRVNRLYWAAREISEKEAWSLLQEFAA